jgi:hypothetical protein
VIGAHSGDLLQRVSCRTIARKLVETLGRLSALVGALLVRFFSISTNRGASSRRKSAKTDDRFFFGVLVFLASSNQ